MGLLDKIKGKKEQKHTHKHDENVLDMVKDTSKSDRPPAAGEGLAQIKDDTGSAYKILSSPHLSEKTTGLAQHGRYVFKVDKKANKIEVAKAVEKAYDVKVVSVNILNTKGKTRRMGRKVGSTSDWKKAVVTLKPGDRIAGLVEGV